MPYTAKALRREIMKRSELESKHVKNKTNENLKSYKKQRNFCSKLYKKERKKYYEMLDLKNATDYKEFWKTVQPFLSDKVTTFPKISLEEKGEIISDESKVANSFSNFFIFNLKMLYVHLVSKQTNILSRIISSWDCCQEIWAALKYKSYHEKYY